MPAKVIKRVHLLACRQKANPGLVFLDRDQQPFNKEELDAGDESDDDDDDDYVPDDGDDYDDKEYVAYDSDNDSNDDDYNDDSYDDNGPLHDDNDTPGEHKGVNESNKDSSKESSGNDEESHESHDESGDNETATSETAATSLENNKTVSHGNEGIEAQMDSAYGKRTSGHNLCPCQPRSYKHLHVNFQEATVGHLEELNKGVDSKNDHIKGVTHIDDHYTPMDNDKPLALRKCP